MSSASMIMIASYFEITGGIKMGFWYLAEGPLPSSLYAFCLMTDVTPHKNLFQHMNLNQQLLLIII